MRGAARASTARAAPQRPHHRSLQPTGLQVQIFRLLRANFRAQFNFFWPAARQLPNTVQIFGPLCANFCAQIKNFCLLRVNLRAQVKFSDCCAPTSANSSIFWARCAPTSAHSSNFRLAARQLPRTVQIFGPLRAKFRAQFKFFWAR